MPVEQYQRSQEPIGPYTVEYGEGWYIIQREGKVLKHVSSPVEMGLSPKEATEALTRETAIADIETLSGMT